MTSKTETELEALIGKLEKYNKIAEELNRKAEAAKARQELLEEQFNQGVAALEGSMDVKLQGKGLKETLENVEGLAKQVLQEYNSKLEAQMKVLRLVQNGEYEQARVLLEGQSGAEEGDREDAGKGIVDVGIEGTESSSDKPAEVETVDSDDLELDLDADDEFNIDFSLEDDEEVEEEETGSIGLDDDDFGSLLAGSKFSIN